MLSLHEKTMGKISVSRKELYEKIWMQSLTKTAKELDVSAAVLKAECVKHNIPTPSSAYWSKLAFGKEVSRDLLPDEDSDLDIELITLENDGKKTGKLAKGNNPSIGCERGKTQRGDFKIDLNSDKSEWLATVQCVVEMYPVRSDGNWYNKALIDKTIKHHKIKQLSWLERDKLPARSIPDTWLDVDCSTECLPRLLAIFDSLVSIFQKLGFKIETDAEATYVYAYGYKVKLSAREHNNRKAAADSTGYPAYEYVRNGQLKFNIGGVFSYQAITVADTAFVKLESKISNIVMKVLNSVVGQMDWEKECRRHELEREKQAQIKQQEQLEARNREMRVAELRQNLAGIMDRAMRYVLVGKLNAIIAEIEQRAAVDALTPDELNFLNDLRYASRVFDPCHPFKDALLTDADLEKVINESLRGGLIPW